MNIIALVDGWGKSHPDRVAHVSGERRLTFGELLADSDHLAANLLAELPAGDAPIVVLGHKEPEMLIAFLAVVKTGRAYIPLDTSLPESRVAQIAEDAGCPLVLTPQDVADRLSRDANSPISRPARSAETPHYIIFTSGSTGKPKGVVITSKNLSAFLEWMTAEQRFTDGDEVFLNQAPFSFDLSVMDLYLSLVTGGTLFSVTKEEIGNPRRLYEALGRSSVTTWVSTPSFAQLCLADPTFTAELLPRIRRFLFCGETLPPFVAAGLLDRFPAAQVWNTYGPTEATVAMTSIPIDRDILSRCPLTLPVGFVMPGDRVEILDDRGAPLPTGGIGEVVIHGPNVSVGYLGRPDLNAKAFGETEGVRFYRTGDWGHLDAAGLLFVGGRQDGQIKLNGYRIELGDIESNLRELPAIRAAIVMPLRKEGAPDLLAAFVVLADRDGASDLEVMLALRSALGARLPAYMVPKKFIFLETFPMTPNGKVDRAQLAALL